MVETCRSPSPALSWSSDPGGGERQEGREEAWWKQHSVTRMCRGFPQCGRGSSAGSGAGLRSLMSVGMFPFGNPFSKSSLCQSKFLKCFRSKQTTNLKRAKSET